MPRCSPKARPRSSSGVRSAISASRGGVRSPFPNRSTTRSPITCHAAPVTAMTGRTTTAMKYPSTIMGPRRGTRSASRPAPSFTNAAANSAAPSSAPRACGPPPRTPVTNAGSNGYIISLAKSLSSETQPNNFACRGSGGEGAAPLGIEAEAPADQRDREAAVAEQSVVEAAQRESLALGGAEVLPQLEDLAPPHRVAQRLDRLRAVAPHLRLRVGAVHAQVCGEILDGLLERHAPGVQPHVEQDTRRAPQQVHALEKLLLLRAVEPLFAHHVLTVQRPAFDGERRPHVLASVRGLLLRMDQVEVVAGIPFVQRGDPDLVAAVVTQHALLSARRQRGIGQGDVEPA